MLPLSITEDGPFMADAQELVVADILQFDGRPLAARETSSRANRWILLPLKRRWILWR